MRRLTSGGRWELPAIRALLPVTGTTVIEAVLRRDRLIVIVALGVVAGLAWLYTLAGVGMGMTAIHMTAMADMDPLLLAAAQRSPTHAVFVSLMWWIMMIAMMTPSAAPMVLLFAAMTRRRETESTPYLRTAAFVAGYLAVWALFSVSAAILHWGLDASGLLTPMMATSSTLLGGLMLVAAGLYQLTPLKQACLGHCRRPAKFIAWRWRTGIPGALRMGGTHGAYCLGCCWFLMGLLFVGGIMNVYWIAGIASYVLAEKLLPHGNWLGRAAGLALTIAGAVFMIDSL